MAGSLEFIKSANTTSNVSSLSVTDCFSDKYDVYKVILEVNEVSSESALDTRLIDSGGSVISATEYDTATLSMEGTTFYQYKNVNSNKWQYTGFFEGSVGGFFVAYIFNPNDSSSYTFITMQNATHWINGSTPELIGRKYIGVHKVAEQITGINIFESLGASTITNAKINVFGVKG
jgi:hypothetical protein